MAKIADDINAVLSKISSWIISEQNKDGSWSIKEAFKYNIPAKYQGSLMLTSQATQALIYANLIENTPHIFRGLNLCSKETIKEYDLLLLCWKSCALRFTQDISVYRDLKRAIDKKVLDLRTKKGIWKDFPALSSMQIFSIINAMYDAHKLTRFREWLLKTRAEKYGWGIMENFDIEHVSSAEIIIGLVLLGESPKNEVIQNARKLIEANQQECGGWTATKFTSASEVSSYSTAVCTLALLLTSENPFNSRIKAAITYLVSMQNEDGSYYRYINDKTKAVFLSYYITRLLSFYLYLEEQWNKPAVKLLRSRLDASELTSYLFHQFESHVKERFNSTVRLHVIDSHLLGSTDKSVDRRINIIRILNESGPKSCAEIIDSLKLIPEYQNLNKKYHLTQIKLDVERLRESNILQKDRHKYYAIFNFG